MKIGLTTGLTIAFIVLKLCGVIDWSWFWVVFPTIVHVLLIILAVWIKVVEEKQKIERYNSSFRKSKFQDRLDAYMKGQQNKLK